MRYLPVLICVYLMACGGTRVAEVHGQQPAPSSRTYTLHTSSVVPDRTVEVKFPLPDLDRRDARYLSMTYELGKGVGNANYRYLMAYAIGSAGDTTFRRLLPLGTRTKTNLLLPLPRGELVEAGVMKTNGGNTYARTTRVRMFLHDLKLVSERPERPVVHQPADEWLIDRIYRLQPGEVLDLEGRAYLLRGQLLLADLADITIRNGIIYADRNRFDNRGNRQDFFRLRDCRNVTLEDIHIYGIRRGDYRVEVPAGKTVPIDRWLSPHYEPQRGPVYRIDVVGNGAGRLQLRQESNDSLLLDGPVRLTPGDTLALFIRPGDPLSRIVARSQGVDVTLLPFNSVKHVYKNEFSSGVMVGHRNRGVVLRRLGIYTVMGDGVQVNGKPENTLIEQVYVNGGSRQGASVNGGVNTRIRGLTLHNTGRSGLDVEPYSKRDTVRGLTIRRLRTANHRAAGFIANNWHRIFGLDVEDVIFSGTMGDGWKGGGVGARVRGVKGGDFGFRGKNSLISDLTVYGGGVSISSGQTKGRGKDTIVSGNNVLDGFVLYRLNSSSYYLLNTGDDGSNTVRNGVLSDAYHTLTLDKKHTTAYLRGKGRVENVVVEDYERYFPNMVLDGSPTRPLATAPSASLRVKGKKSGDRAGGRLQQGQTYYYRLAVVPRGQPEYLLDEQSVESPGGAISLSVANLADPDNGYVYHTLRLYRGSSPEQYDTVFPVAPLSERCGWNNRIELTDLGDRLIVDGGLISNSRFFGYPVNEDGRMVVAAAPNEKSLRR